jgi:hypothetical protein
MIFLDAKDRLPLLPASFYEAIDPVERFFWSAKNARYGLPTEELIAFLKKEIGDRTALEIGAGMGDLGSHLGIKMTDSAIQVTRPELSLYYRSLGHAPTDPPPDVERIDALEAIKRYKPDVVVGSWITQLYRKGDEEPPKIESSIYGVDEEEILRHVKKYIHIGNAKSHGQKRILFRPHHETRGTWICSRSLQSNENNILIWKSDA